jgi:exonuclease III
MDNKNAISSGLRLLQWNCRSVKQKDVNLTLLNRKQFPDIICLTETWLDPLDKFTLYPHTKCYREDRQGRRGGGVAILTHAKISSAIYKHKRLAGIETVAVTVKTRCSKFIIVAWYSPPKIHYTSEDLKMFFSQFPDSVIICGDFNAHNTLWGSQKTSQAGNEIEIFLSESSLVNLNEGTPTYSRRLSSYTSCIDLAFATDKLSSKCSWTVIEEKSNPNSNKSDLL